MAQSMMPISNRWFQGAVVTYLIGFTVLGILAYLVYRDQPPLPARVVAGDKTLLTRDDIMRGMNVFQRRLMEYGSIYGHGAYLGPILPPSIFTRHRSFSPSVTKARR